MSTGKDLDAFRLTNMDMSSVAVVRNFTGKDLDAFGLEGVLPIRRFIIVGGQQIATLDLKEATQCNAKCLENAECDAWQLDKEACHLFADSKMQPLDSHQANDNDPHFVVGFIQRRAKVLRPISSPDDTILSKRVLYILHFHHEVIPHAYKKIVNEILPSSWQSNMDLVVITPREIDLEVNGIHASGSSLRNPFWPQHETSRRGANGHMSLPIARAKFPGYGGYLLVNDDAMIKTWELKPDVWFGDRPWGTFDPSKYSEQKWVPRRITTRYPYGPYPWSWYNHDSGSTSDNSNLTRSNFDAALAALNEFCRDESMTSMMDDTSLQEFCIKRAESTVTPLCDGKSDVFYVPGSDLGTAMSKAMTLFGEHDVFMEISYPMVYHLLVPGEQVLEVPYCDDSRLKKTNLEFIPYYTLTTREGYSQVTREKGDCPVIHPIKFGNENSVVYWKEVVERDCSWCEWKNDNQTYWEIVD